MWLWCVPGQKPPRSFGGFVFWSGWMLATGVAIGLAGALVLGHFGVLSTFSHLLLNGILALLGGMLGYWRARRAFLSRLTGIVPALVLLLLAGMVIMALPGRTEWVLGGWDPGVYVNQGSFIGKSGSFGPFEYSVYKDLAPEHRDLFRYGRKDYQQIMPGIPIDPDTGDLHVYFFRLLPSLIAVFYQSGGVEAVVKVNTFVGFWAAFVFAGMVTAYFGVLNGVLAGGLLMVQPLFLYHLQITTTEMLQLFLLSCLALIARERRTGIFAPVMLGLIVAGSVINRADFFVVGAIFLMAVTVEDITLDRRWRVNCAQAPVWSGLLAGAYLNSVWSPMTELRIRRFMGEVDLYGLMGLGLALFINLLATIKSLRAFCAHHARSLPWVLWGLFMAVCLTLFWAPLDIPEIESFRTTATRLYHYYEFGPILVGLIGSAFFVQALRSRDMAGLGWWVFVLLIIHMASMLDGKIAGIYPYATRRFFVYMIPVLALFSAFAVGSLWNWPDKRRLGRVSAAILICLFGFTVLKPSYHAWSRAEYEGMMQHFAGIADNVAPGDIVVVDHAWWGTPLYFLFDVQVLNGSLMLLEDNKERVSDYLEALKSLKEQGYSVRFLTSTGGGMDIFPIKIEPVRLDWAGPEFVMQEIQHHPRGQGFPVRHRHPQFSLYTWTD
jgi:hypothetical protein